MEIDWSRIAEPQPDGYDIRATLDHLPQSRYGTQGLKPLPPGAPRIWPEGRAVFVRMADAMQPSSALKDLPHDDPSVKAGLALIDNWPAIRPLCAHLLLALCPMTQGRNQLSHGCTCGNFGDDWGWIYVTADNDWGFAEGIVHEMAHWKLRTFGVWFEEWTPFLLANSMTDRYVSPVRKDMERPMGAVLHGYYSYVHVAALCVAMLKASKTPTSGDYDWTDLQLKRVTEGQATMRAHAVGTPEVGVPFLAGLDAWATRVLEEGHAAMAAGAA